MKDARITLVTLGVDDLERAALFYVALGWERTDAGNESVVFLQGERMVLSLFGRADLARDAGQPENLAPSFVYVTLAINMTDRDGVDRLYGQALAAGARPVKPPAPAFWGGYSGYFADPDGHLWELAHNPFFPLTKRGHVDLSRRPAASGQKDADA